jgi:hypothetical protein
VTPAVVVVTSGIYINANDVLGVCVPISLESDEAEAEGPGWDPRWCIPFARCCTGFEAKQVQITGINVFVDLITI